MARVEEGLPVVGAAVAQPESAGRGAGAGRVPNPVAGVETAVRTVVQNVLNGLFGRN